jgi:Hypervirulence associated proteins TUDOR domain
VGDFVGTRFRGGTHEGKVERIITSKEETPHPPKVVLKDERGHEHLHNPGTLSHNEKDFHRESHKA